MRLIEISQSSLSLSLSLSLSFLLYLRSPTFCRYFERKKEHKSGNWKKKKRKSFASSPSNNTDFKNLAWLHFKGCRWFGFKTSGVKRIQVRKVTECRHGRVDRRSLHPSLDRQPEVSLLHRRASVRVALWRSRVSGRRLRRSLPRNFSRQLVSPICFDFSRSADFWRMSSSTKRPQTSKTDQLHSP